MNYLASDKRYDNMKYNRCGKSGLKLPLISLGIWRNFGGEMPLTNTRLMLHKAFDLGITHIDMANNYGPPAGSAEENFGTIYNSDFKPYRDELILSSKAGYGMWSGPYGDWGSKKYLVASIDQSLKRTGLEYFDIFYHHRPDPETPLEETMGALDLMVRQGKALYVGISNYRKEEAEKAIKILKDLGTPCLIHQPRYNMFDRWSEDGLLDLLVDKGVGSIAFSPLSMGQLTDKFIKNPDPNMDKKTFERIVALTEVAQKREQSLAQMAIAWLLRDNKLTSVLIGASKVSQIEDSVNAINNLDFSKEELSTIESILL